MQASENTNQEIKTDKLQQHIYETADYKQRLIFTYKSLLFLILIENDYKYHQNPKQGAEKTKKFYRKLLKQIPEHQEFISIAYYSMLDELNPDKAIKVEKVENKNVQTDDNTSNN